ncbi:hypothetical protein ACOSQ4_013998 [Xanthoceras sorbifolium]
MSKTGVHQPGYRSYTFFLLGFSFFFFLSLSSSLPFSFLLFLFLLFFILFSSSSSSSSSSSRLLLFLCFSFFLFSLFSLLPFSASSFLFLASARSFLFLYKFDHRDRHRDLWSHHLVAVLTGEVPPISSRAPIAVSWSRCSLPEFDIFHRELVSMMCGCGDWSRCSLLEILFFTVSSSSRSLVAVLTVHFFLHFMQSFWTAPSGNHKNKHTFNYVLHPLES